MTPREDLPKAGYIVLPKTISLTFVGFVIGWCAFGFNAYWENIAKHEQALDKISHAMEEIGDLRADTMKEIGALQATYGKIDEGLDNVSNRLTRIETIVERIDDRQNGAGAARRGED